MTTTQPFRLSNCRWSKDAERILARSCKWFPLATVEDYRRVLESDSSAGLYRLDDANGQAIGFAILKVEQFSQGAEGVILACAANAPGVDLIGLLLPTLEGLFVGVSSFRVTTARPGLIRKLSKHGWQQTHAVMRKTAPC